jgi:tetratricopeptide (TPR) repeat protein
VSEARLPALVGRRRELATLEASFAAARDGNGCVVTVAGEPGIGKTRITEEFTAWARQAGAEVLVGRCYEGEGAPAFWPWLQVLRSYLEGRDAANLQAELGAGAGDIATIVPELRARLPGLVAPPSPLEPDQARFRVFDTVTAGLGRAAAKRPLIVMLDDLQGADRPSLLLLQFLAREVRRMRVLVVGAHRDVGRDHPLAETLAELVRERGSEQVVLGGLTTEEVAELVSSVTGTAPSLDLAVAVRKRTEGNPLYVVEVARTLKASAVNEVGGAFAVPANVRIAITQRLDALSPECRRALTLASVFGREFGAVALARAAELEPALVLPLLDEASTARLVGPEAGGSRWRFTHILIAEVLAESLSVAQSVTLHCRAAAALACDRGAEESAAQIAQHWLAAGPTGDPEQAVTWACRAGERALRLLAYEDAIHHYRLAETAVVWLDGTGARREVEVLIALGEAQKLVGERTEAKTTFRRVLDLARRLQSPEVLTRAALGLAPTLALAERPEFDAEVLGVLEEAIGSWSGADSALHARALALLGMGLLYENPELVEAGLADPERRWRLLDDGVAMARRVGDPATLRAVLANKLFWLRRVDALDENLAVATELVVAAERAGDTVPLLYGRVARTGLLLERGNVAGSDREAAVFARLANDLRQPVWMWLAKCHAGVRAIRDGRFAEAERLLQEAVELGQGTVPFAAASYFAGSMLFLQTLQGRQEESLPMWKAMFEDHPEPAAISPLAWAESELGQSDFAWRVLERLSGRFDRTRDSLWMLGAGFLGATCANIGHAALAESYYEWLLPYAGRWIAWMDINPLWPVDQLLAALARTLGRWDASVAHGEGALAAAVDAAAPPHVVRARYELALALRGRAAPGDPARAQQLLAEAGVDADRLGMMVIAARIADIGRAAGGAAVGVAPSGPPAPPSGNSVPLRAHVFRREGDYWTVGFAGTTIRMRDMRGFQYLARLLREPGRRFHVSELVSVQGGLGDATGMGDDTRVALDLGDAGPLLDLRASRAYRARLNELREQLDEAERQHDLGKAERAREEIAALRSVLGEAARRGAAGSHGERARLAVTKAMKVALDRLAARHSLLGAHLRATIRRGYYCVYLPDPHQTIAWET